MNGLTEKIIGALGLGLAGLIATFFLVFNERFKRWLKKFFGLNDRELPGSEQQEPEPPKPVQFIVLIGHWSGYGWRYTLKGHLHRNQVVFEGQLEWTFQEFPTDYEYPIWAKRRIGRSATELVNGVLNTEKLTLSGYKVIDPDNLGLLLKDYSIEIDEHVSNFKGMSINHSDKKTGCLTGTISVQR